MTDITRKTQVTQHPLAGQKIHLVNGAWALVDEKANQPSEKPARNQAGLDFLPAKPGERAVTPLSPGE
jgi:hypothetical protein